MQTASRFFNDFKKFEKEAQSQKMALLGMHVRYAVESKSSSFIIPSLEKELTLYFANMGTTLSPIVVHIFSVRKITKQSSSLMIASSSALYLTLSILTYKS